MSITPIKTDRLIFGTMRLAESMQTAADVAVFLIYLHKSGINQLHVSDEYESYQLLCDSLKIVKKRRPDAHFSFTVKLGEPHFDQYDFSKDRLIEKVQAYCSHLGTEKLTTIQWMWRHNIQNDGMRTKDFQHAYAEISAAVKILKEKKLIENFFCFPYTTDFAKEAVQKDYVDGLVVYYNPEESEYREAIHLAKSLGKPVYSIRPFAAGKLFSKGWSTEKLLKFTFSNQAIEKVIFTATKEAHLDALFNICHAKASV